MVCHLTYDKTGSQQQNLKALKTNIFIHSEMYILKSFIVHLILLWLLNQEEWYGWGMWHIWR
jgi:hypothetical protein